MMTEINGQPRPLVSAVIPTHSRPELVCRAVRSALAQTYKNIEILVVIDGPDAATVAALGALDDPRIHVIALKQNVGGGEARNIGARAARGEFIALLDDDDEWLPTKLEMQVRSLLKGEPHRMIVTCRHIKRTPGKPDTILPRRAPFQNENISEYLFMSEGFGLPLYGPQTSTFVAPKSIFMSIAFKKDQPCHQDWDWFLRVINEPNIVYEMLDEPLSVFHVTQDTCGITKRTRWRDSFDWINSVRHLISPSAYASFLVHQVMYRCDEVTDRLKFFRLLSAQAGSDFRLSHCLLALKWYLFSPGRRTFLRRCFHHS